MDFPEETSPKGSWDESTFFEIKLYCVDFQLSPSNPSHPDFFPFPGDAGDAESSDDEFGSESAAGEEEQAEMLKAVKFPEVEEKSKLPSLAPKVAKCLQKRSKAVQDLLGKFSAEKLTDVQQGFPGRTCISFLTLVFEQQNKTHFFSGFIPPKKMNKNEQDLRLKDRLGTTVKSLTEKEELIMTIYSKGIQESFTKESLDL